MVWCVYNGDSQPRERQMDCQIWAGRTREGLPIKGNKSVHRMVSGLNADNGRYYITTCGESLCVKKEHIVLFDGYDIPIIRPIVRKMHEDGKSLEKIASFLGIGQMAVKNILK